MAPKKFLENTFQKCRSSRSWMFFRCEACKFIKKRMQQGCFPVDFAKFLRTAFFMEHLRWLLLKMVEEFLRISNEKDLRNCNRKLFLRPPQK